MTTDTAAATLAAGFTYAHDYAHVTLLDDGSVQALMGWDDDNRQPGELDELRWVTGGHRDAALALFAATRSNPDAGAENWYPAAVGVTTHREVDAVTVLSPGYAAQIARSHAE